MLLCVHSSFAIILKRKRKLVALLLLSYRCIVTINVLWIFLTVPWVGLPYVIVVFPDHTHLLFCSMAHYLRYVDGKRQGYQIAFPKFYKFSTDKIKNMDFIEFKVHLIHGKRIPLLLITQY